MTDILCILACIMLCGVVSVALGYAIGVWVERGRALEATVERLRERSDA